MNAIKDLKYYANLLESQGKITVAKGILQAVDEIVAHEDKLRNLYDYVAVELNKVETERNRLKEILAESCDENRQEYFSSYDCASPCPIGYKVQELKDLNDEHQSLAGLQEMVIAKLKGEHEMMQKLLTAGEDERNRLRELLRIAYEAWPLIPDEGWLDLVDTALT